MPARGDVRCVVISWIVKAGNDAEEMRVALGGRTSARIEPFRHFTGHTPARPG